MFMSAEAHANHLREVHGGEGGSVVLKLPGNLDEDEDVPENPCVWLVIKGFNQGLRY